MSTFQYSHLFALATCGAHNLIYWSVLPYAIVHCQPSDILHPLCVASDLQISYLLETEDNRTFGNHTSNRSVDF